MQRSQPMLSNEVHCFEALWVQFHYFQEVLLDLHTINGCHSALLFPVADFFPQVRLRLLVNPEGMKSGVPLRRSLGLMAI